MFDLTDRLLAAALLAFAPACTTTSGDDDEETDTESVDGGSSSDSSAGSTTDVDPTGADSSSGADDSSGGTPDAADPSAFFVSIAGLWVAPVTSWTSAGSFPTMNMDVRAASDGVLFSRVDLDSDNSLRFAFALEEHEGQPVLSNGLEVVFGQT